MNLRNWWDKWWDRLFGRHVHAHCWHFVGAFGAASSEKTDRRICCDCGRREELKTFALSTAEHGPFDPAGPTEENWVKASDLYVW